MKDRSLAARLQSAASTQFAGLRAAGRVCTNASGDAGMKKASTRLLEQETQTPSPAPDLIPAESSTENLHWDWYSKRGALQPEEQSRSNLEKREVGLRFATTVWICRPTTGSDGSKIPQPSKTAKAGAPGSEKHADEVEVAGIVALLTNNRRNRIQSHRSLCFRPRSQNFRRDLEWLSVL